MLLTMWTPAVAAITTSRIGRQLASAAIKRVPLRRIGLGLLIGWLPGLLKALFLSVTQLGKWDNAHFELASDSNSIQAIHHIAVTLGAGPQSFSYFALNMLLSITFGSAILALIGGVGEELGWRVFLQPAMDQRFGRFIGTCFVGLIWAYWRLPVNLAGYNDNHHPLLNALLFFPIGITALSFGFAWLTRSSKSVWPAALAHGANNTIGSTFLVVAKGWSADTGTELLSLLLVGAFFAWRSCKRQCAICRRSSLAGLDGERNVYRRRNRKRFALGVRNLRFSLRSYMSARLD